MTSRGDLARGLGWACAVIFFLQVVRQAFFVDDAFISFRYAMNLVQGHGLVFNPGEAPVEGYTNFLWVVLLAAALQVGVLPEVSATLLGALSGALVLWITAWFSASRTSWSDPRVWAAPMLLALSRSFTAWSTGGLETQFFALLLLAAAIAAVREHGMSDRVPWRSGLLLGLLMLTRPDGALAIGVLGAFLLVDIARGHRPATHLVGWSLPWIALVGGHLAFRRWMYDAWVPNTFHAKVNGLWWEQSWAYLSWFNHDYNAVWFGWLALAAIWLRRERTHLVFAALLAAQLLYVSAIGGDRFEYRFLVHVAPLFAWLVCDGAFALGERMRSESDPALGSRISLGWLGFAALMVTLSNVEAEVASRDGVTGIGHMERVTARRARQGRRLRELIDRGRIPELRACFQAVGAISYYTELHVLDYHGLNDRTVATQPTATRGVIAHEKAASVAYMREQGVGIYDPVGQILVGPREVREASARAREKVRALGDGLLMRCRVVGPEEFLVYATPLSPEEEEAQFGHLDPCTPATTRPARRREVPFRHHDAQPHLVFISIDTLRADHLGAYGGLARTPHLDAFAAEAAVFEHFVAGAPSTLAAHTTLMTGTGARTHGVPRNGYRVHGRNKMLAERMGRAGYHTYAAIGGSPLGRATAFDQGFATFDDRFSGYARPGSAVTRAALKWFDRPLQGQRFAFVHYFDAHAPYEAMGVDLPALPPGVVPVQGRPGSYAHIHQVRRLGEEGSPDAAAHEAMLAALYAAGVERVDAQVGKLLAGLRERGVLDHAVVVITADHGEAFTEHGERWDHGHDVHRTTQHIPLFIRLPDGPSGVRIQGTVPAVDLLPTLLELLEIDAPGGEGRSAAGAVRGQALSPRGLAFSEATRKTADPPHTGWPNSDHPKAARDERYTVIYRPRTGDWEAYDRHRDPLEQQDIWSVGHPRMAELQAQLLEWGAAEPAARAQPVEDPVAKEQLEALGYLGD